MAALAAGALLGTLAPSAQSHQGLEAAAAARYAFEPNPRLSLQTGKPALMAWNRKRAFLIVNKEGERLGELVDFVIDRQTGRLSHTALVLEQDGKAVCTKALPVRELRWDAGTQRFRSLLSRAGIESLPDFSTAWLGRLELGTRQVIEAGHRPLDDEIGFHAPRFVLAGDVEGATVEAEDGDVGSGLGVILDMNPGEAAYFLLGSGDHRSGELFPIPWNALVPTADGGYAVPKSVREMMRAPAISKELIASLTMAGFRMEVANYYGVPSRIDQRLQRVLNKSGS